jgi:BRCA1-associated protein
MRAYFFHIAFELHPRDIQQDAKTGKDTTVFLPPPGTDIFGDTFPIHSIAPWGGHPKGLQKPSHKRTRTDPGSSKLESVSKFGFKAVDPESHRGDLDKRPSFGSESVEESLRLKDWRFDSVSIVSIDMEEQQPDRHGRSRGKSVTHSKTADAVPTGPATRGRYVPSDPKNTEVGWGVVHLYRDAEETPGLYDDASSGSESGGNSSQIGTFDAQTCTTLCILAVPSYMTPADLLGYVGEQTREDVSHFKLIRTGQANKYMVLMKFRDATKAKSWQKEWNGKPFNSMEVSRLTIKDVAKRNTNKIIA